MKFRLLLCIATFAIGPSYCQDRPLLKQGMVLPACFSEMYKGHEGRPVIFDLFSSTCSVCFANMPKLQILATDYKGSVDFVLIGHEDGAIQKVYERFRKKLQLDLEVHFDRVIFKENQITTMPVYIWVGADGLIQAISGHEELTKENIELFKSRLPIKKKKIARAPFDPYRPFLENGNGQNGIDFLSRTVLSIFTDSTAMFGPLKFTPGNDSSIQLLGVTMQELYLLAYRGISRLSFKDSLYGKSSNEVVGVKPDGIRYSFSMFRRGERRGKLQVQLKTELQNLFGYRGEWRIVPTRCWVLKSDGIKSKRLLTKNKSAANHSSSSEIILVNQPVSALLYSIYVKQPSGPPFIDHTGLSNIDITIDTDVSDMTSIQSALKEQGLSLSLELRKMRVLHLFK